MACLEDAETELELGDLKRQIKNKKSKTRQQNPNLPKCDCKPLCDDLIYNVITSQSPWEWFEEIKTYNSSKIAINFDKNE